MVGMKFPKPQTLTELLAQTFPPLPWHKEAEARQAATYPDNYIVSVSYCPGSKYYVAECGPKAISRYCHKNVAAALKALAWIDEYGCGGGCKGWHALEPRIKREATHIERNAYEQCGGVIPEAYRLPSDGKKSGWLALRYRILDRDGARCRLCGSSPKDGPEVRLEIDHIIPRSRGGTDDPSNLRVLCFRCNRGKGAQLL